MSRVLMFLKNVTRNIRKMIFQFLRNLLSYQFWKWGKKFDLRNDLIKFFKKLNLRNNWNIQFIWFEYHFSFIKILVSFSVIKIFSHFVKFQKINIWSPFAFLPYFLSLGILNVTQLSLRLRPQCELEWLLHWI